MISETPTEYELYGVHSSPADVAPGPHPSSSPKEDANVIHCPICLESLSQIKQANQQMHSTSCGHLFCKTCITRAIKTAQQCPTCRQRQDTKTIHPIFI